MPSVSAPGSPGERRRLDFDYPENSVISLPSLKSFLKVSAHCVLARVLPGFQIHLGVIKWKNNPVHSERGKEFLKQKKTLELAQTELRLLPSCQRGLVTRHGSHSIHIMFSKGSRGKGQEAKPGFRNLVTADLNFTELLYEGSQDIELSLLWAQSLTPVER